MKRVYITMAVGFVALLGVIVWRTWPDPEPVYQGKPLSFWLTRPVMLDRPMTKSGTQLVIITNPSLAALQADGAVRHIGTNAIPTLLWMLRARDPALKVQLMSLAQRQHLIKLQLTPAKTWNYAALCGFEVLGTNAHSAVPAVTRIAEKNTSRFSQMCALWALVSIAEGEEAAPTLLRLTTNADANVSSSANLLLRELFPTNAAKAGITNGQGSRGLTEEEVNEYLDRMDRITNGP